MNLEFSLKSPPQAVVAVLAETETGSQMNRQHIVLLVCLLGFITGLAYVSDNGLYLLDLVDFYINSFGMLSIGHSHGNLEHLEHLLGKS